MRLTFHGAAHEVTGSCYLAELDGTRFLVECGMFQAGPEANERNARPFPFDPRAIAFVLLTHAHIDHTGLIPKLALQGYRGPVYATTGTADLLTVLLPDAGHIQEMEADPIYTLADAEAALKLIRSVAYDEMFSPHPKVQCCFRDAGHILGSASLELWAESSSGRIKVVFSGDLGQPGRPILRDPTLIKEADILLVESTYGDRPHKGLPQTKNELVDAIEDTIHHKRGNVIIPAFAVGRTQEILYYLYQLTREGRLKDLNVFVDSPMATRATEITARHLDLFDDEAKSLAAWQSQGRGLPNIRFVETADESRSLHLIRSGAIVIAASGMCDAGRIRHHLRHNLPRRESTILFAGFQAEGTLGRRLVDGAQTVRLFGELIPVSAEIRTLGGLSAHADRPALLDWLRGFTHPPRHTFVVHGEPRPARAIADTLARDWGWQAEVPRLGDEADLKA